MGFYIRKSISAGPFRFNLSGSGLGLSVGVKGFRVGTGPRGNYVHMGRGGLYYRASLNGQRRTSSTRSEAYAPRPELQPTHSASPLADIETGDVLEMRPASGSDILLQINAALSAVQFWPWALAAGVVATAAVYMQYHSEPLATALALAIAVACGALAYFDRMRKTVVIAYDLDDDSIFRFKHFVEQFDALSAERIWNIDASGDTDDWKHNAGASRLLKRTDATLTHDLPSIIKTNISVPAILSGRQSVYFLPDVVLIVEGSRAGALTYDQFDLSWKPVIFIEDGGVPSDAKVVGYTWKYVNKRGGPDKRFNDNRQIPEVMYLQMSLSGQANLRKVLQFSRLLDHGTFDSALGALRQLILGLLKVPLSLTPNANPGPSETTTAPKQLSSPYAVPSDEASRLERDKREYWEYLLTIELLRLWAAPLLSKWDELRQGRYKGAPQDVPKEQIVTWCQERLGEVSQFAKDFQRLLAQDLPASWGPAGLPGDTAQIEKICKDIASLVQTMLVWEESVRFAVVPSAFEDVRKLLEGSAGLVIDEVAKAYEELSRVFVQGRPSGQISLSLKVAVPEGWAEKFDMALAKARRSLRPARARPTARPSAPGP